MFNLIDVFLKWTARTIASLIVIAAVLAVVNPSEYCDELVPLDVIADGARNAADNAKQSYDEKQADVRFYHKWFKTKKWAETVVAEKEYQAANGAGKVAQANRNQVEARCAAQGRPPRPPSDKPRALVAVYEKLSPAAWILAGAMLLPILIKVVFYFGLAPMAATLPPVRIFPRDDLTAVPQPSQSEKSIEVDVAADEEILLHSDFVQSSSRNSQKRTEWLLNARLPLSSLASGMVGLTRIQPADASGTRVVVSSQKDPLSEVGLIELPTGAAMVLQARTLAGVVKRRGASIDVSPQWRLNSPHAWLTLQFRYLVFRGPCKLIVQGCRGVRAESPEQGNPRLINQAATIGFSPNLEYSNTRCETFFSYLRGQEDLFNDLFAGGPGWYLYEEMPAAGRRTGLTGRGLEGVVDAFLKAFGI